MKNVSLLAGASLLSTLVLSSAALAHDDTLGHRPDDHAPIGVMRDHVHNKGEVMLSYRYGHMGMDGMRSGTDDFSTADVLGQGYMMSPLDMRMTMHMWGAMYGVTDQFTVGVMGGFAHNTMQMQNMMGATTNMSSSDWTDTKVNGMYEFFRSGSHRAQFNLGVNLPTGSIDEKNGAGVQISYAMQTGSGTWDFTPGVSFTGHTGEWSWGGQLNALLRTGDNDRDYTLGDRYNLTAWGARKLNHWWSVSARLDAHSWEEIDGADASLNAAMTPINDATLTGGERVDAYVGANFIVPHGNLKGQRFGLEVGTPIYQDLDGLQMKQEYRLVFGWQYAF